MEVVRYLTRRLERLQHTAAEWTTFFPDLNHGPAIEAPTFHSFFPSPRDWQSLDIEIMGHQSRRNAPPVLRAIIRRLCSDDALRKESWRRPPSRSHRDEPALVIEASTLRRRGSARLQLFSEAITQLLEALCNVADSLTPAWLADINRFLELQSGPIPIRRTAPHEKICVSSWTGRDDRLLDYVGTLKPDMSPLSTGRSVTLMRGGLDLRVAECRWLTNSALSDDAEGFGAPLIECRINRAMPSRIRSLVIFTRPASKSHNRGRAYGNVSR